MNIEKIIATAVEKIDHHLIEINEELDKLRNLNEKPKKIAKKRDSLTPKNSAA